MSAFFAAAYTDRIEILTDGATYRDDGTLTDIGSKIFASDETPLAVTGRGETLTVAVFCAAVLAFSCGGFDACLVRLSAFLAKRQSIGVPGNCEILIAGISETNGPQLWFFATHNGYPRFEPYMLHNVGPEFGGGNPLTEEEVAGLPSAESGLAELAVPLFEAMRSKPGFNPAAPHMPAIFGIGGHIDRTVVTADGATTTRLHTWPDAVGEKIDPMAAPFDDGALFSDGSAFA
ncbi:hypothetical protein [Mesorhizobium sp. CA7]|uniref:hypothetical protein n=1 Tax=Mesorhizobium sp. CA7 TaxID=588501 RepID=UPI001CCA3417|nr:hypothetical protein [Mesorhizobium sp. CA7]MBZ9816936.1 hypothetical protein [Mesorhizobium sp. CA7]